MAKVRLTGQDGVTPLINSLNRRIEGTEEALKGVSKQSKVTQADAERLWRAARTPADKYNDTLRKANALLDGTAEGQRKYAAVVAHATTKLREQNSAMSLRRLAEYGKGMVGIAAAIAAVTRAMTGAKEISESAAQSVRTNAAKLGVLGQLDYFGGTEGASQFVNRLRRGGLTEERAGALAFDVGSLAPSRKDADLFGRMATSGLVREPGKLTPGLSALRASYGIQAGRGAEMLLTAARGQPATAEGLGSAIGQGTYALSRQLGLGAAETIAAGAVLSELAGSPEVGRTQLLGIMGVMQKQGREGVSLQDFATEMSTRTPAQLLKDFPERRGRAGIAGLSLQRNREMLSRLTAEVGTTGQLERRLRAVESDPRVAAATEEEAARQSALIANEGAGIGQMRGEVGISEAQEFFGGFPMGRFRQYGARGGGEAAQLVTDDPRAARAAAGVGGALTGSPVGAVWHMVSQLMEINEKQGSLQPGVEN